MRLDELFNKPTGWKWVKPPRNSEQPEEARAQFKTSGKRTILVRFNPLSDDTVEMNFVNKKQQHDPNYQYGITGEGDATEVLATSVDILKAYMELVPFNIELSAEEDNRASLYQRMLDKMLPPEAYLSSKPSGSGTDFHIERMFKD